MTYDPPPSLTSPYCHNGDQAPNTGALEDHLSHLQILASSLERCQTLQVTGV